MINQAELCKNNTHFRVAWRNTLTGEINVFGDYPTYDEAYQSISDWWKKHDFTPGYVRVIVDDQHSCFTIDYTSHYFFYDIHCSTGTLSDEEIIARSKLLLPQKSSDKNRSL